MTEINSSLFIFTFVSDKYRLVSKALVPIFYTITRITDGERVKVIDNKELLPGVTIEILLEADGEYELFVDGEELTDTTVYFNHWVGLRKLLIPMIKTAVCPTCDECCGIDCMTKEAKDCLRGQSLFNYTNSYLHLVKPFSTTFKQVQNPTMFTFIQRIMMNNEDFIRASLYNQIFGTAISGLPSFNEPLFNYYISVYYLGLYNYFKEALSLTEVQGHKDLDIAFDYKAISTCIQNLGFSTVSLTADIIVANKNKKVYYWQETNLALDLGDIQVLLTPTYLAAKDDLPYKIFEDGYVVDYTNVGRPVFVLDDVDDADYAIIDALNNNVTETFDVQYISGTRQALFVSKEFISVSDIYFKFKQE